MARYLSEKSSMSPTRFSLLLLLPVPAPPLPGPQGHPVVKMKRCFCGGYRRMAVRVDVKHRPQNVPDISESTTVRNGLFASVDFHTLMGPGRAACLYDRCKRSVAGATSKEVDGGESKPARRQVLLWRCRITLGHNCLNKMYRPLKHYVTV